MLHSLYMQIYTQDCPLYLRQTVGLYHIKI